MTTGQIKRVPVTRGLSAEFLDPEVRGALDNILPTVKSEKTKHQFVRELLLFQTTVSRRRNVPTQTNKTRYAGELVTSRFFDRVGVYNPEQYPVSILDKMRVDAQIAHGMNTLTGVLRGLEWSIECADEGQKRFLDFAVRRVYSQLIRPLSTALYYGFSSNEIVWENRTVTVADIDRKTGRRKVFFKRPAMIIKLIKDHHPASIRVVIHPRTGDFLGISQTDLLGNYIYLKRGLKLLFFGFEQEFGNWFGKSRMIPSYKPWYWAEMFTHYLARYMERRGTPPVAVYYPNGKRLVDGSEIDAGDHALKLGAALLESAVVAIPSEFDIKGNKLWGIEYLNDDKRADMFAGILNQLNTLKTRGLGIPDRAISQGDQGGTSSGSESGRDLLLVIMSSFIQDIQQAITEKVVEPLQSVNYLEQNRVAARFMFQKPDLNRLVLAKELAVEQMRLNQNMISNGLVPNEVISVPGISRQMNIPIEDTMSAFHEVERPEEVIDVVKEDVDEDNNTEEMTEKEIDSAAEATEKDKQKKAGEVAKK